MSAGHPSLLICRPSLHTAALLLSAAMYDAFPSAVVLERGSYGFTFYCDVALPHVNADAKVGELLLLEVGRFLGKRLAAGGSLTLREMLPTNAAAFLKHVGSRDHVDEDYTGGLATIVEIEGEYFVAEGPLVAEVADMGICQLCAVDPLPLPEGQGWRFIGLVAPDKQHFKQALKAFERARASDPHMLMMERELALFDSTSTLTSTLWLPRGVAWCHFLANLCTDDAPLPVQAVVTSPAAAAFEAHCRYAAAWSKEGGALPLLLGERPVVGGSGDSYSLFCESSAVVAQCTSSLQWIEKTYKILGIEYRWRGRFAKPNNAISRHAWHKGRLCLEEAVSHLHLTVERDDSVPTQEGPALDVEAFDRWGRGHLVATLMLPVTVTSLGVIHYRRMLALEMLAALLLEQGSGVLPPWLAPEQLRLLTVTPAERGYAATLVAAVQAAGFRAYVDAAEVPLERKIFRAERAAVPNVAVVGAVEAGRGVVTLRLGRKRQTVTRDGLLELLQKSCRPLEF